MNYFRARKALERFREYRRDALLYWLLFTAPCQDAMGQEIAALTDEVNAMSAEELAATRLRIPRRLNELAPALQRYAYELGMSPKFIFRIPLDGGGGEEVEIDVFANLTDRDLWNPLTPPPARSLDIIDMCVGAADLARSEGLKRLVIPIYWLVDVPALLIRWPWLILEAAGLPPDIERNTWSYVLKAVWFLVQIAALLLLVAQKVRPDLIRAVLPK